jgi:aspartate/methionine/tyrosine aminotransferase
VLNVFSFSKAHGMMGWRVGYLLAPVDLMPQLAKAQVRFPNKLTKRCFTLFFILKEVTLWIVFV